MICDHTTKIPQWHEFAAHCRRLRQLYGLPKEAGGYELRDLGGRNCATIWFTLNGVVRHITCSSEAASQRGDNLGYARHSEKACLNEIQQELNQGAQIVQVYTERFPCGPQNQNCYSFLQNHSQVGQDVRVYWSIEWPDASDLTGKPKPGKGNRNNGKEEYDCAAKKAKLIREAGNNLCKKMGATSLTPGPWGTR